MNLKKNENKEKMNLKKNEKSFIGKKFHTSILLIRNQMRQKAVIWASWP